MVRTLHKAAATMFSGIFKLILPVVLAAVVGASVATVMAHEPQQVAPAAATPLSNAFTFQGKLKATGAEATGPYDFVFILFDGEGVAASQVGTPIQVDELQVNGGLFAATLNFGAGVFNGQERWLEVRVRAGAISGANGFEILGRQQLTATPYALYAKSTDWANIANVPSGFLDGVDANTTYTAGTAISITSNQISVQFEGSGESGSAARSDHKHFGQTWLGDSGSPGLSIYNSGPGLLAQSDEAPAIGGVSMGSTGVLGVTEAGEQAGVLGRNLSQGSCAPGNKACGGVVGTATSTDVPGVQGMSTLGAGLFGVGILGIEAHGPTALYAQGTQRGALVSGNLGLDVRGLINGINAFGGRNLDSTINNVRGTGLVALGSGKGQAGAGVVGRSSSSAAVQPGGECTNGGIDEWCIGVLGTSTGSSSVGVYGQGQKFGVYGIVTDPIQSNGAGILGIKGTGQWAGRFQGPVLVEEAISCPNCNPVLSDARAKRDIMDLPAGLAEVLRLHPVSFDWDPAVVPDDTVTHNGLLAQEVREVLPQNVYENANGYLGVNYPELIPVLIKAIQEQDAKIAALESGNNLPAESPLLVSSTNGGSDLPMLLAAALIGVGGFLAFGGTLVGWKMRRARA
ncbi:hypothetical protein AYO38_02760 [bacterium SCGC AG-212-C10]|nr:hypothetical protein AYO38_02760 [bacterium SCGC AG-212-C10]